MLPPAMERIKCDQGQGFWFLTEIIVRKMGHPPNRMLRQVWLWLHRHVVWGLRRTLGRWWGADGRSVAEKRGRRRRGVAGAGANAEALEGAWPARKGVVA
jgi:hypothetical protein